MAIGDKAAAKGLAVFAPTQLVSRVYEYLNTRGDELATLMDRVTTNETNAKAPPTVYTAQATGGTGTDLQSITELITIPAKAYDRVVTITFRTVLTALSSPYCNITLRKNQASTVARARVNSANISGTGAFTEKIPANTAVKYQLAAESPNGSWSASADNTYTDLTIAAVTI